MTVSLLILLIMEKIIIDDTLYLSAPSEQDKWALVNYLNDEDVQRFTLRLPYPYTEKDAETFLQFCLDLRKKHGRTINWMIRNSNGEAIGCIGLQLAHGPDSHRDEIGYWLGKEYWGHGIMTKVVKKFSEYLFNYLGLIRIEAYVFEGNESSNKVLEKNGFKHEGFLHKVYDKKGKYISANLYAAVK